MATKKDEVLEIRHIDRTPVELIIVGDSPLIVHAWSEKAKRQMLEAQTKKTKTKAKEIRNPYDEFINSMYWITEKPEPTPEAFAEAIKKGAKWGFPVAAVKQAANSAAYRMGWVKNQMQLRGSYFLESEYGNLFEIEGSTPDMREDMVRIGMGSADLRYRAEFKNWRAHIKMIYNANGEMTLEQILNCINAGGFACGIGEWRPEKDGMYGMYHVEEA